MEKNNVTIIHNSLCTKCRLTLGILESKGIQPDLVRYLDGELTRDVLMKALSALGMRPKEVLRMKDVESLGLTVNVENDQDVIEMILKHPQILERPIVIRGDKAVIGRPPENIFALF